MSDQIFRLLGPEPSLELTDEGWLSFAAKTGEMLNALDRKNRLAADKQTDHWNKRHAIPDAC